MLQSTPRQLEIFAQIVATGNLVQSAVVLEMSVERVTAELNALERRLGLSLFERSDGMLSLTPAGRRTIAAMEMLSTQDAAQWAKENEPFPHEWDRRTTGVEMKTAAPSDVTAEQAAILPARDFARLPRVRETDVEKPTQNIVLAAHQAIFSHFQDALTAFEETSPDIGITLRLEGLAAAQVPDILLRGKADIAYFYATEEPQNFASRYAWSERVSLFVGSGHPLAQADAVLATDLVDMPYLALGQDNVVRILSEAALARTGLRCPEPAAQSDNLYELMTMVQQGKGWFAALGPLARDFGKMKNIVRLPYAQGLPQVEVRQAIRPDMARDPAVSALAEYLSR